MSVPTPMEKLIGRVESALMGEGYRADSAHATAIIAVDAFYAGQQDDPHFTLVAAESYQLVIDAMPTFVTHMRAALQQMTQQLRAAYALARQYELYAMMAAHAKTDRAPGGPEFDASGLPRTEGAASPLDPEVHTREGEPCIEDGCGSTAVPGGAFCADCVPQATESALAEAMIVVDSRSTSRAVLHPFRRPPGFTGPAPMFSFYPGAEAPDVLSIEVSPPPDNPVEVIEMTPREVHLSVARRLRELGCTWQQLTDMHDRGDFETAQHHSLWFAVGGTINPEQLDRAQWVLTGLEDENGVPALVSLEDHDIERLERDYPTDRITGAPHHYIINGDHSACGCSGHDPSCQVWDVPYWNHKPTLCRITRTLCLHVPKHTYGEACGNPHENMVGRTTEGEDVRGPAAG